jgi:cytochrome c6
MIRNSIITCIVLFTISCGQKDKNTSTSQTDTPVADAVDGAKIFKQYCELCHGADGKLGANGSKDLTVSDFDLNERIAMITNGKGAMTKFEGILSLKEIKAVAEYSMTLKK